MDSTRFLLPFTQDLDGRALAYAVQFTRSCQATLVPLVLFPLLEHQGADELRLEVIEQANDFFEAVTFQSGRAGVQAHLPESWISCDFSERGVVGRVIDL